MNVRPAPRGFADPVLDAQAVFRAVMTALARPGTVGQLPAGLAPPSPLTGELAAVALALFDHETPLWIDAPLAAAPEVAAFLRFHTGAQIVENPAEAAFALVVEPAALPPLAAFAHGTDEYPDRSTTLVLAVTELRDDCGLVLAGPGIKDRARLALDPLPGDFAGQLSRNRAVFPRGVDCVFVAAGKVAALPRSTRLMEA
jgi:alpha-D-ribose 1-methylphosphonate 5-triphosphate synthase subunit PhnH